MKPTNLVLLYINDDTPLRVATAAMRTVPGQRVGLDDVPDDTSGLLSASVVGNVQSLRVRLSQFDWAGGGGWLVDLTAGTIEAVPRWPVPRAERVVEDAADLVPGRVYEHPDGVMAYLTEDNVWREYVRIAGGGRSRFIELDPAERTQGPWIEADIASAGHVVREITQAQADVLSDP